VQFQIAALVVQTIWYVVGAYLDMFCLIQLVHNVTPLVRLVKHLPQIVLLAKLAIICQTIHVLCVHQIAQPVQVLLLVKVVQLDIFPQLLTYVMLVLKLVLLVLSMLLFR
jgi:hypothetical protein